MPITPPPATLQPGLKATGFPAPSNACALNCAAKPTGSVIRDGLMPATMPPPPLHGSLAVKSMPNTSNSVSCTGLAKRGVKLSPSFAAVTVTPPGANPAKTYEPSASDQVLTPPPRTRAPSTGRPACVTRPWTAPLFAGSPTRINAEVAAFPPFMSETSTRTT